MRNSYHPDLTNFFALLLYLISTKAHFKIFPRIHYRHISTLDDEASFLARGGGGAALVHPRLDQRQGAQREGRQDLGRERVPRVSGHLRLLRPGGGRLGSCLWLSVEALRSYVRGYAHGLHWPRWDDGRTVWGKLRDEQTVVWRCCWNFQVV